MDIRTFGQAQRTLRRDNSRLSHEVERLRAENARLTNELDVRIRQLMDVSRHCGQLLTANEELRAELGQCASENNQLTENAAELGKALDMALAERDQTFAEMDEHSRELDALRDERPRLLAANVRLHHDNIALRANLDNERNAHNATAAQLYAELAEARAELDTQAKRHAEIIEQWKAEEKMWRYYDKKQLAQIADARAELDAMRQAHSVVAAKMAAMGC